MSFAKNFYTGLWMIPFAFLSAIAFTAFYLILAQADKIPDPTMKWVVLGVGTLTLTAMGIAVNGWIAREAVGRVKTA